MHVSCPGLRDEQVCRGIVSALRRRASILLTLSRAPATRRRNLGFLGDAGMYTEEVFRGIDYVLAQAARFDIKVIVVLCTYWENHDGVGNVRHFLLPDFVCVP